MSKKNTRNDIPLIDIQRVNQAIPNYDTLNAKTVVRVIRSLKVDVLLDVLMYERHQKRRISVLRAVCKKISESPEALAGKPQSNTPLIDVQRVNQAISNYDTLNAKTVVRVIRSLKVDVLLDVLMYERHQKRRISVLRAVCKKISESLETLDQLQNGISLTDVQRINQVIPNYDTLNAKTVVKAIQSLKVDALLREHITMSNIQSTILLA